MNPIQTATINWQSDHLGNTVPISDGFDDVYFSHAGGLDESHYVFLVGNDLPQRLSALQPHARFVVAETGFGIGLNFLALCQLWQKLKQQGSLAQGARLHFISTEKFPLKQEDLAKALAAWQQNAELYPFIERLITQYPLPLSGCHRLTIDDDITLDLWFGDALQSFDTILTTNHQRQTPPKINAWFLDGFAPSKNSDLWSDDLFHLMQQLSAPHATFATFTSAGFVRRGLQAAGFIVSKKQGFGRKREMITGYLPCNDKENTFVTPPPPSHVAIIGTGVSGLCSALAFAKRGILVTLFDKTSPLAGASGNPRALFAPKLSLIEQVHDHLSTIAFLYAARFYDKLNADGDVFDQRGVVDFLLPTQKSAEKLQELIAPYPDELIHQIDEIYPEQKIHALVPKAGLICPRTLARTILSHPLISWQQADIQQIHHDADGVTLHTETGEYHADKVVISAGFESHLLHHTLFNPRKIRGQVSWLKVSEPIFDELPVEPIKYDGYCAKFCEHNEAIFLMGASFVRNCTDTQVTIDEHDFNISKLHQGLPKIADLLDLPNQTLHGRASIRAQTPDYHPIIGKVSDNIYAMYGMGSKGFTFAPLCAEILSDLILDDVLPISHTLLEKLSPHRHRLQTPLSDNDG